MAAILIESYELTNDYILIEGRSADALLDAFMNGDFEAELKTKVQKFKFSRKEEKEMRYLMLCFKKQIKEGKNLKAILDSCIGRQYYFNPSFQIA